MKAQLITTLENARHYTMAVATIMPEADYEFKPVETVWNFRELLHHIGYGIYWWQDNYIKGIESPWAPPAVTPSREETLAYLEKAFAGLEATLNGMTLTDDAVKGFHATLDHLTHHRGQATTYLRCRGITPPEYVYG